MFKASVAGSVFLQPPGDIAHLYRLMILNCDSMSTVCDSIFKKVCVVGLFLFLFDVFCLTMDTLTRQRSQDASKLSIHRHTLQQSITSPKKQIMTTSSSPSSPSSSASSSSSSAFKLRDYVAVGIFLLSLFQNLRSLSPVRIIDQQQQQYSSSISIQEQQMQHQDSRIMSNTDTTHTKNDTTTFSDDETSTIRRWGCNLQQTPLIYVHIGKAGGGMVRARFAASALDFGIHQKWQSAGKAYYPVRVNDKSTNNDDEHTHNTTGTYEKAYFCNSGNANFRAHGQKSFEGTLYCHATTPLGQAVACPMPIMSNGDDVTKTTTTTSTGIVMTSKKKISNRNKITAALGPCRKACNVWSDSCHVVYVGHNLLGSEMHWLPPRVLSNWWKNDYLTNFPVKTEQDINSDKIQAYLQTLEPDDVSWCPYKNTSRPVLASNYIHDSYTQCSVALGQVVDKEAFMTVQARQHSYPPPSTTTRLLPQQQQQPLDYIDWSHVYASMPVLRTTIIRDPFSWLVSKFFWHGGGGGNDDDVDGDGGDFLKCDDVEMATKSVNPFRVDDKEAQQAGWANKYALNYITYLCGEDCAARYQQGLGNLQQMEQQGANNLRHSFAVVGLLEETDTFYDMVTKRVQYVNMSLNPSVHGEFHSSGNGPEQLRCKEKFADSSFQALLIAKSPIIAAVDRLYHVGVQVNRFQLEELKSCPATTTPA